MTIETLRQLAQQYRDPYGHPDSRIVDDFDEEGNLVEEA